MRILSFDAGGSALHLSLLNGREPILERCLSPDTLERQEIASQLMLEIDSAFQNTNWKRTDLEAVVVGIGPGSFTGVRIAVITARTLCQILQLPLLGVSFLEVLAAAHSDTISSGITKCSIVLPSTSSQYFYGAFELNSAGEPARALIEPACAPIEQVEAALSSCNGITWLGDEKVRQNFSSHEVAPLPELKNIATRQAQLAFDRVSLMGKMPAPLVETFPWQKILPLYLRAPSVTLKKNHAAPNPAHDRR